jgi:putative membrane protein
MRRGDPVPGDAVDGGEAAGFGAVLGLGGLLWCLCAWVPASLPVFAPWQFSWPAYLATALVLWWFWRGLRLVRIERWRLTSFVTGVLLLYAMLQTRFDYWAQHMFFLSQIQHFVLQDLGPFLIALAAPGMTLRAGLPGPLFAFADSAGIRRIGHRAQQPVFAALLFIGATGIWLIPSVQFRAMLDPVLYGVMNASMVGSGLLFWCLLLDPRPAPPARTGRAVKLALALLIGLPMIGIGTVISTAPNDLYLNYSLCGRLFPGIDALADQQIGALILWMPAGLLTGIAAMLLAKRMFEEDDRRMMERLMETRR